MDVLLQKLISLFGLSSFRTHQREVIEDVLAGHDVVCVMPTGAGKSLCFQFPAATQAGLTIIVSPLISLMADQVADAEVDLARLTDGLLELVSAIHPDLDAGSDGS